MKKFIVAALLGSLTLVGCTISPLGSNSKQSCVQAIEYADQIIALDGEFIESMIVFPDLIVRALNAGLYQNVSEVNAITEELRKFNEKTKGMPEKKKQLVSQYQSASSECKK